MKSRETALIVGADGLIGRTLSKDLALQGAMVYETTRRPETISERRWFLDLTDDVTNWRPPCRVSVAYLCAAMTSLEQCRKDPVQSTLVNVMNIVNMAKTLAASGTSLVFLSTNLVYNGSRPFRKAEEPVCPTTEYGRQKAQAEKDLLALGTPVTIVRLTKVISSEMPLLTGWLRSLKSQEVIHPFADLKIAPIALDFAVDVLRQIGERQISGIVQVSGREDVSYADIATSLAQRLEIHPDLVQPIEASQSGIALETLPLHTTLDTTRLRQKCAIEPPDIWSTINTVFAL
jgi:dTDP-4-dehydrorhamnose reductase